jgi:hypothetical protein
MALGFTQPLTEMSTRKYFWRAERGRRVRLITSPPPVSRHVSQHYRPLRPVTGIALPILTDGK